MSKKKGKQTPRRSASKQVQETSRSADTDLPVRGDGEGVQRSSNIQRVVSKSVSFSGKNVSFSGPLPPPPLLKQYDEIVPGAAERVIRMAEKALDHEIDFGRTALVATVANTKRGQLLAFSVVLIVLGCAMIALYTGHETLAQTLGGGTVISLAAVFVLNRLPEWIKSFGKQSE